MGAVIGHELTHGFDDFGSQFGAGGELENWWTTADREEFERRAQVLREQYSAYVAIDDLHVDGELTLGENIADLGGVTIAYDALQIALGDGPRELIDGFTPEQRFFLSWARRGARTSATRLSSCVSTPTRTRPGASAPSGRSRTSRPSPRRSASSKRR